MHEKPVSEGPDSLKIRFPLLLDDLGLVLAKLRRHGYRAWVRDDGPGNLVLVYEREDSLDDEKAARP